MVPFETCEDQRVRQALALKLQMSPSNELLRLLAQERQHLVDQPFGLPALQSCRSREVFHQFVQVGRLSVVHANLQESLFSWKHFARIRAKNRD